MKEHVKSNRLVNGGDFKFDVDAPIWRISDEAILLSLQEFVAQCKLEKPTGVAYDLWPAKVCTADTVGNRFGGWRAALGRIGVVFGTRSREYSVEELLDNLEHMWRQLGYPPGKRKISKFGAGISERPYVKRWGSVRNACLLLAQYNDGKITQEQLLGTKSVSARGTIPLKVRWDVMKRGNYMCAKCGSRPPEVSLEIDHIVPLARGGTDAVTNLQVLCNPCNQGKKARID
jgi:5-methylcytosine-specific restriction endonuclease McrA